MLTWGQGALVAALVVCAWTVAAGLLAGFLGRAPETEEMRRRLAQSAGRGLAAAAVLLGVAVAALLRALLTDDFSVEYVADYSSRAQALPFKLSALWAGQSGSLLFWAALLAVCAALFAATTARRLPREIVPWAHAALGAATLFFAATATFVANPFVRLPAEAIPADGQGMNPLLQNVWMVVHPPTLYLGYVACAVPWAIALGALAAGRLDGAWAAAARRWALASFAALSLGIWLGGYWAYIELGWGGFWAWDPVENASLMPWLTLAALVHSIAAERKRGALRATNMILAAATFLLAVYGTFLTRSGIIQSVHAFSKSSIGNWFLGFIAAALLATAALLAARRRGLKAARIESVVSREAAFALGDVVFAGLAAIVFALTMYPVFSQLFVGRQITFEPPQFTEATRPWFLLVVALTGLAPLVSWRGDDPRKIVRRALAPLAVAAVAAIVPLLGGAREPWSVLFFAAAGFVAGAAVAEFAGIVRSRAQAEPGDRGRSLGSFLAARRARIGGLVSHFALALMVIGAAASTVYKKDAKFGAVRPGQTLEIDGYRATYERFDVVDGPTYDGARIVLSVVRPGGGAPTRLGAEMRQYGKGRAPEARQPSTEVAILATGAPRSLAGLARIGEDLYVVPLAVDFADGQAAVELIVHPMINWIWAGGALLLVGTLLATWPPRRAEAPAAAEEPAPGAAR